jgi:hypothetical protein
MQALEVEAAAKLYYESVMNSCSQIAEGLRTHDAYLQIAAAQSREKCK